MPDAPGGFRPADDGPHLGAPAEEWWFSCWRHDGSLGLLSGWRRTDTIGWYWAALARRGRPLLHMTEWSVPLRADPLIAKAHEMWSEIECVAPFEQWTIGNEMYAAALDEPDDAWGRAHGQVTPVAMDLEWYATTEPEAFATTPVHERGYRQRGVVHGVIELPEGPIDLVEAPAQRWHRWGSTLGEAPLDRAAAHLGLRAPTLFPDGTVADLVLTSDGWRRRASDLI